MPGALMLQGTGADVGTSVLAAGLCRLLANRGARVAPFAPVNATAVGVPVPDGGDIGRAAWLQAVAARRAPSVHMNPVLAHPAPDAPDRIVCRGKPIAGPGTTNTQPQRRRPMTAALESYRRLRREADVVVVDGAGSAADVGPRPAAMDAMGFACAADLPVVLVADGDPGGLTASLVGAHAVLEPAARSRVRGYVANRVSGHRDRLDAAFAAVSARTQWPPLGGVPIMAAAADLPALDAAETVPAADASPRAGKIAVPLFSQAARLDDLDPFRLDPDVAVEVVPPGRALPGDADLVVLPHTAATMADLRFLRRQGWDLDVAAHVRRGGQVIGIGGGYRMLGRRVRDPHGLEAAPGNALTGLGLLAVETELAPETGTRRVSGRTPDGSCAVAGEAIQGPNTFGPATAQPMLRLTDGPEGASSADGRVRGCDVHGLFATDAYRRAVVAGVGHCEPETSPAVRLDRALDAIADGLARVLDTHALLALVRD